MCFKASTKIVKKTDEHSAMNQHFYTSRQKKDVRKLELPNILHIWFCFKLVISR